MPSICSWWTCGGISCYTDQIAIVWINLAIVIVFFCIFFFWEHIAKVYSFRDAEMSRQLHSFPVVDKSQYTLHRQHNCWWPGNARNQVFISHCIDLVITAHSDCCTRKAKLHWRMQCPTEQLPSYNSHQIPTLKRLSYCLAAFFAESLEARCQVENEDVVGAAPTGDAPTTSDSWSTIYCPLRCTLY